MDALRAFEKDALALFPRLLEVGGNVGQMGHHARGRGHDLIKDRVHGERLHAVERGEEHVLFLERGGDLGAEQLGIGQIGSAHAHAGHLVLVAGTDAPARGADLLPLFELVLAGLIKRLVVGHDEVRLAADLEAARGNVHALRDEGVELLREDHGIEDDAVADQTDFAFVQDAGGNQMQRGFLAVHDNGMAGVVAALKADHVIDLPRQQINDLPFSLVAPLDADDHHIGHGFLLRYLYSRA